MKIVFLKIVIFVAIVVAITSCNQSYTKRVYSAIILNEVKILQDSTIQRISAYKFPAGFLCMLRTVDSIDVRKIGAIADDYYDDDKIKHPEFFNFTDRGVYILVSKKPSFIQLRLGHEIRPLANWNGIGAGGDYIKIQKIAMRGELDKAALEMVNYSALALPKACTFSGFKQWIYEHFEFFNEVTSFISSRLVFSKLSPDSFYSKYILKPFFEFHIKIGSLWLSYILIFSFAFIAVFVANKVLFDLIFMKLSNAFRNSGKFLLGYIFTIIIFVPAINSRGMLVGSRMEDRIKLEYLNIKGFENIIFPEGGAVDTTSWWLAIIFALLFFISKYPKVYALSVQAENTPEKQLELYADFKKNNPVEAWFLEFKLNVATKEGIDYDMKINPYTYMSERYLLLYSLASLFLGFSFWLFLPKTFTLVSIYLLIISLSMAFVSLLFKIFREA